jgi:hypothetical protein
MKIDFPGQVAGAFLPHPEQEDNRGPLVTPAVVSVRIVRAALTNQIRSMKPE